MSITDKFTKTVEVRSLAIVAGNKRSYPVTADITTIGHIEPASAEDTMLSDGQMAQQFTLYTPVVAIEIGDQLAIDSKVYQVGGVQTFDIGSQPHLKLVIYEPNT